MASEKHSWKFFRAGGVDQVIFKTGDDIGRLADLDQKLWVTLACPVKGTEIDERTLVLVDTDHDGRIRPPEVLGAIAWSKKVFKNLDIFLEKGDGVPLNAFSDSADGKAVRASAKRILADRGKGDAKEIKLDDATGMETVFSQTRLNGDGIVPPETAEDEPTKKTILDMIATHGSVIDRSGKPGIDKNIADAFFAEIDAFVGWYEKGQDAALRPAGDKTPDAALSVADVESKVNDYFARCRLAAFDPRGAGALGAADTELLALSTKVLTVTDDGIAKLPLSRIEGSKPLSLDAGLNPAWAGRIGTFVAAAVVPLLGSTKTLVESDWSTICSKVAPYRAWLAEKPAGTVDKLGVERAKELAQPAVRKAVYDLIAEDASLASEYESIAAVEKAVRFRQEFARFLRNFVSFADFYGGRGASFQAGTLFLDARSCDLVIDVESVAKHTAMAALSGAYLTYCECSRPSGEKRTIVAAFTDGDIDDLMVGRNGVFYDRKGNDWDATITSIVDNPISIRQAFWAPYKRLVRLIEEQIAKRAAEKEKESAGKIDKTATEVSHADEAHEPEAAAAAAAAAPPAGAPAAKKEVDVGTVAAIGVAVGGIGAFMTAIFGYFFSLGIWIPFGVGVLMLGISGPSMLIAWLKLRRRNLGPILDANGWAVNNRAKINVPFGRSLTHLSKLPDGASRSLDDPFAEKPTVWKRYVVLAAIAGMFIYWFLGKFDEYLPEKARAVVIFKRTAVAPAPAAAPAPSAAPAGPAK